ncbi:MAG: bifunctional phosphopantothenoylcysteine decarboxylase/phosphopantothenate--cysteine ligase CoaBC [Bacteroidaceae bacterium]
MLQGKNIVLGITGSIAAYKACMIVRLLVKQGAQVQAVMTEAGKEFITPLTLSTLTQKPVVSEFFSRRDGTWHSHVDLGLWADAMLIAPATANTLAKMAHGIADNMLLTTYLSMKAPVFVAPAMDLDMYAHPATQENLRLLAQRGVHIVEPGTGFLASTLEGKGRMEEPEEIVRQLDEALCGNLPLKGRTILITAGPTHEKLDPVRFIGNYSSGKMGLALAQTCARYGAQVELVCGPVQQTLPATPGIRRTDVESAAQMYDACMKLFPGCDAGILCAAVADYTPAQVADDKIKREGDALVLRLNPTRDIAQAMGRMKTPAQRLVGFALETSHEMENACRKLEKKNLDFIVLNSLQDAGAGFRHDTNKITIVSREGRTAFPLKNKNEVARDIVDQLISILPS